jgi:hypothetical protein
VSWFSAGVSSAVATKLMIDEVDKIFYIHIDDQHPDSMRFVKDCEYWFDKPVEIMQSPYENVETICRMRKYINGPAGAPCTVILKKNVRKEWEAQNPGAHTYVWGMDCSDKEKARADRLLESMPKFNHRQPLIEQSISKEHAHEILKASGIKRPEMYEHGFLNNNCIGCVKANSVAYWNLTRRLFPDVFEQRAKMERDIGATCMKRDGEKVWLDELDPNAGRGMKPIVDDCGILCEIMAI